MRPSDGFSLLEVSITLFLTSILSSIVLWLAVAIWHAGGVAELKWEQDGMVFNLQRSITPLIHCARSAEFMGNSIHFTVVDKQQYSLAVNRKHQLVEYMPKGGITILSDSVDSYDTVINGKMVTIKIKFQTGQETIVTGDMLGGKP